MRIIELMNERGWSKADLAREMGISNQLLYLRMKRNMRVDTAEQFAKAFNVPMWELFVSKEDIMKQLDITPKRFVCPKCGEVMDFTK